VTRWVATIWQMPELRSRVLFTLGMLAVFRLGVHIPAPGVDRLALASFVQSNQNTMFGLYDMFSGGALQQFSVFVLGVMPYITASIIIQILTVVVPQLERMSKEGQQGKNRITQYTRYATIAIALVQSFTMAVAMEGMKTGNNQEVVLTAGWNFRLLTMITMTAGSCFVMWIGEQISDRGIGNGSSLIITAGIVSRLPNAVANTASKLKLGEINLLQVTILLMLMIGVIAAIVYIERAQRRIPIQYAKRVVGRRVYGGQTTHLPLKINTTGVIPPIFASSVLMIPATLAQVPFFKDTPMARVAGFFHPGDWLYNYSYVGLIVFFAYFYTAMMFNPVDVADNLRKHGGYIPNIRPGKQTAEYIDHLLTRLTAAGALYMAAVCILPTILVTAYGVPFYFGGTGLLIVVNVSLDTVAQVEAQLLTRQYDGLQGPKSGGPIGGGGRRRLMAMGGSPA
jgi:preprotein translocase subunit SecY